jgi:WD40 repeat protein
VWQAHNMALRKSFRLDGRFIFGAMNFSPDGLWLATGSMDGHVSVWDPLTGKMVWDVGRHQGYVYTVGFGHGVRTLLSGGADGVSYLWDLRPQARQANKNLERLWNDLAGEDSAAALQAMWDLSEAPDGMVAFLSEKLRPIHDVVEPDRVAVGLTVEQIQRLDRLKKRLLDKEKCVERSVTVRRAVSVLAQSGSAEALRLLRDLARQNPNKDVAQIAASALKRLGSLEQR